MKRFGLLGITLLLTALVLGSCVENGGFRRFSYTTGERLSQDIKAKEGYVQRSKEDRANELHPPKIGWDNHIEILEEELRILKNSRAAYEEERDRNYSGNGSGNGNGDGGGNP